MKLRIGLALAALSLLIHPVHAQRQGGGGRGSTTATDYETQDSPSGNGNFTANAVRLWAVTFPTNLTATKLTYEVRTADNSANTYDMGYYSATGALLCHLGPTPGTTFAPSTGVKTLSVLSVCNFSAGVRYYFAFTASSATAVITLGSNRFNACPNCAPTSGSTTTGGALNSSITPPADAWLYTPGTPLIALHN